MRAGAGAGVGVGVGVGVKVRVRVRVRLRVVSGARTFAKWKAMSVPRIMLITLARSSRLDGSMGRRVEMGRWTVIGV